MDDSRTMPHHGSLGPNDETKPASILKSDKRLHKDTSIDSQAVASTSQNSEHFEHLSLRPRHDSKCDANGITSSSHPQPKPDAIVPLRHAQKTVAAVIRNLAGEVVSKYTYNEYKPTNPIVVTGFSRQRAPENIELPASRPNEPVEPWKIFPPLANSAFTGIEKVDKYDPQQYDTFDVALDGAELAIKNTPSPKKLVTAVTKRARKPSIGEMVATGIDFKQKAWVQHDPSCVGEIYTVEEQKADFVRNLNEGAPIEYCKKCKETHIPPGSPITLADRDTCGAYLPDWFPSEGIHRPWDNFRSMINDLIIGREIELGYDDHKERNPKRNLWNLEFHSDAEEWKQIGRRSGKGGWWKCRKGRNATPAEKSCRVCTSSQAVHRDHEVTAYKLKPSASQSSANIENWIAERIKAVGLDDKKVVLAMWRTNGIPQHYGPAVSRNGLYPVTEGGCLIVDGARPVTGVSSLGPRTFLPPEQMFSERLFRGNGLQSTGSQSVDEGLGIEGSTWDMNSLLSSNTSPSAGQSGFPKIVVTDSGLGSSTSSQDPPSNAASSARPTTIRANTSA
ncbi:uncharacterized protein Bfra_009570 [Botrytis fragariae]|uniref:Uncharacterized protein n=1 Tax=Botrytis fragariae TaxID=1964551 RepID=A0A8H6AP27_9HELO|nr:uncharacterized protein Bfra_009570 [Botrytis fragariae]KAF5871014.1 hypothetical protein Bfra_009570 [Botrytis fragariae]